MTNEEAAAWFEARLKNIAMPGARKMHKMAISALRAQSSSEKPNNWISVKDRLPENETSVFICATRKFENREIRIISKAIYTDGQHNTETSSLCWDSGDMDWEHDDEADADIIPEGWWEDVNYLEQFAAVDDFVTHWMPLPEPPEVKDGHY